MNEMARRVMNTLILAVAVFAAFFIGSMKVENSYLYIGLIVFIFGVYFQDNQFRSKPEEKC